MKQRLFVEHGQIKVHDFLVDAATVGSVVVADHAAVVDLASK